MVLKKFQICTEDIPEFIEAETADEAWHKASLELGAYPVEEEEEDG